MKLVLVIFLVFSSANIGMAQLKCYRCFGNTWCNNATSPEFQLKVYTTSCGPKETNGESSNVTMIGNQNLTNSNILPMENTVSYQCITAVAFEGGEGYTLRACTVNDSPSKHICDIIRQEILPAATRNNSFKCNRCSSDLCNVHVLVESRAYLINMISIPVLLILVLINLFLI
ncbi:uncharacterized protein LOC143206599 isoform X1 [Rhynchophorus ferrugineus]|uniref:uncharacterized protein LOC143206599 isoform X1 n=2 Tax=Rhynchophorus ferrugineus TaxID=354439 RepID=UPI003FCDBB9D